jgi:hypothetical protein
MSPIMRLLDAHGVHIERSAKDQRIYPDGSGIDVGVWTIPDEVAQRYPEYRLAENLQAIENGAILSSPPFPEVLRSPR